MKKTFFNSSYSLPVLAILAMISSQALADTPTQGTANDPAKKISVKKGALIPIASHPDIAKGLFIIENKSSRDLLLQNVSSPICDHVTANHSDDLQLSNQTGGDNIFKHLAIPHNAVMVFPSDGYHLICYGLKTLQPGQTTAPFTFYFRGDIKVTTSFTLQSEESNNAP